MDFKVVSSGELGLTCWNPSRFFEACHLCKRFQSAWRNGTEENLKCPISLNPEILELLTQKRNHQIQIREINIKIKGVKLPAPGPEDIDPDAEEPVSVDLNVDDIEESGQ